MVQVKQNRQSGHPPIIKKLKQSSNEDSKKRENLNLDFKKNEPIKKKLTDKSSSKILQNLVDSQPNIQGIKSDSLKNQQQTSEDQISVKISKNKKNDILSINHINIEDKKEINDDETGDDLAAKLLADLKNEFLGPRQEIRVKKSENVKNQEKNIKQHFKPFGVILKYTKRVKR